MRYLETMHFFVPCSFLTMSGSIIFNTKHSAVHDIRKQKLVEEWRRKMLAYLFPICTLRKVYVLFVHVYTKPTTMFNTSTFESLIVTFD